MLFVFADLILLELHSLEYTLGLLFLIGSIAVDVEERNTWGKHIKNYRSLIGGAGKSTW